MTDATDNHIEKQSRTFTEEEVKAIIDSLQRVRPSFILLTRKQAAVFIRKMVKDDEFKQTAKSLANLVSEGKGPFYLKMGNKTMA